MRRTSNLPRLFVQQICWNPTKVNASGFPSPRSARFEPRESPAPDQPCLVFIEIQPILAQAILHFPEVAPRLVLALDADNGIVGAAHNSDVAARRLPPLTGPVVEHIMQVHVAGGRGRQKL